MRPNETLDAPSKTNQESVHILKLAGAVILIGAILGLMISAIGSQISPPYYEDALGFPDRSFMLQALLSGLIEGLVFGIIFAIIYSAAYHGFFRNRASWRFLSKELEVLVIGVFCCWVIGGIVGLVIEYYTTRYVYYPPLGPPSPQPMDKNFNLAWVNSSILGARIGVILMVFVGVIRLRRASSKAGE